MTAQGAQAISARPTECKSLAKKFTRSYYDYDYDYNYIYIYILKLHLPWNAILQGHATA